MGIRRAVLAPALVAALLAAGCGKSTSSSSGGTPSASGSSAAPATGAAPGSPSSPAGTGSAGAQQSESASLAQAQQDIKDLDGTLGQVDAGLNANPGTEGDVNP
jgi:hypothetical protein